MPIQETYNSLMSLYNELKHQIQNSDRNLYERWKAGGFLIDDDIISMYPNLTQVVEILSEDNDVDNEEEEE